MQPSLTFSFECVRFVRHHELCQGSDLEAMRRPPGGHRTVGNSDAGG